jgi:hypothetical protein
MIGYRTLWGHVVTLGNALNSDPKRNRGYDQRH